MQCEFVRGSGAHEAEFLIFGKTSRQIQLARTLLSDMVERQAELQHMHVLEQLAKQDLNAAQKEIADGLRVEFNVDPDLIGLVIGKNGDNIRRAKDLTGQPTITVDREKACRIVAARKAQMKMLYVVVMGGDISAAATFASALVAADVPMVLTIGDTAKSIFNVADSSVLVERQDD